MIKNLRTYRWGTAIPFLLFHVAALGAFFVRYRWSLVGLMLAMDYYALRLLNRIGIVRDLRGVRSLEAKERIAA